MGVTSRVVRRCVLSVFVNWAFFNNIWLSTLSHTDDLLSIVLNAFLTKPFSDKIEYLTDWPSAIVIFIRFYHSTTDIADLRRSRLRWSQGGESVIL